MGTANRDHILIAMHPPGRRYVEWRSRSEITASGCIDFRPQRLNRRSSYSTLVIALGAARRVEEVARITKRTPERIRIVLDLVGHFVQSHQH